MSLRTDESRAPAVALLRDRSDHPLGGMSLGQVAAEGGAFPSLGAAAGLSAIRRPPRPRAPRTLPRSPGRTSRLGESSP
jgi:hypothetical protein